MPKDSEGREPGEPGYEKPDEGGGAPPPKKGGNLLQKFNSSPMWVKIGAIAGVAGVGLMWYISQKNSNAASTPTQTGVITGGSGSPTDYTGEGDIYPPAVAVPITSSAGSTTPTTTPTPAPPGSANNIFHVKQSGAFASTPGGTNNGGQNYGFFSAGQAVSLLNPTPSVFNNTNYYQVSSNGQTGYVRGSTIGQP